MTPSSRAAAHTARALRVAGEYRKRAPDPIDRFSEVIFGLIMVLAFTCSVSVAQGGSDDVHEMLVAALACNLAWGLVDGVMYVLTSIAERSRRAAVIRGIHAADPAVARSIVLATLPEGFEAITDDAEADRIAPSGSPTAWRWRASSWRASGWGVRAASGPGSWALRWWCWEAAWWRSRSRWGDDAGPAGRDLLLVRRIPEGAASFRSRR